MPHGSIIMSIQKTVNRESPRKEISFSGAQSYDSGNRLHLRYVVFPLVGDRFIGSCIFFEYAADF